MYYLKGWFAIKKFLQNLLFFSENVHCHISCTTVWSMRRGETTRNPTEGKEADSETEQFQKKKNRRDEQEAWRNNEGQQRPTNMTILTEP